MPPKMPKNDVTRVAIVGATGLVGTSLYHILDEKTYQISVVGRSRAKLRTNFRKAFNHLTWAEFKDSDARHYDVIINLAGAGVSDKKWTTEYKLVMVDSRIDATKMCTEKCRENPKIRLINASAVSAYGFYAGPSIRFDESNQAQRTGHAFLQDLIDKWEETALEAEAYGSAVTLLRIGVVFHPDEGALPAMMQPFRYFIGGPVGSGQQMISWISTQDLARIMVFLISHPDISGPVNCVSPGAVSNREFAQTLGEAMRRPSVVTTPALVIRAAMGQMGDELIVKGQHVYPQKLIEAGFEFSYPNLRGYFSDHFGK
ncbi:MAG: TIGR01777 family protein [Paraglaciecola sp.]|nr:TIGR01777 family protein [Paraglaciecola sp.]